jgi:hypothetical protein
MNSERLDGGMDVRWGLGTKPTEQQVKGAWSQAAGMLQKGLNAKAPGVKSQAGSTREWQHLEA